MKTFIQSMILAASFVLGSAAFGYTGSTNGVAVQSGSLGVTVTSSTDSFWSIINVDTNQVVAGGFVFWNYGSYYVGGGGNIDGVGVEGTGSTGSTGGDAQFTITGLPPGNYAVGVDVYSFNTQAYAQNNYLNIVYWNSDTWGEIYYYLNPE